MPLNELKFEEDYSIYDIFIPEQDGAIILSLCDDLDVVDEILTEDYQRRVIEFIHNSHMWFELARQTVLKDTGNIEGLYLTTIYILSEQNEKNLIFGLSFALDFDREHGRGLKMAMNDYSIIEYGDAYIAFS